VGWGLCSKDKFRDEIEKLLRGRAHPPILSYLTLYKSQTNPSDRASLGDRCSHARIGQISRLLPGDDLRRFSGRREPGGGKRAVSFISVKNAYCSAAGKQAKRWRKPTRRTPVSCSLPRKSPRRLPASDYQKLRQRVLERDGWRCQCCGQRAHLELHHLQRRSRGGADSEENLVVLCSQCHRAAHSSDR